MRRDRRPWRPGLHRMAPRETGIGRTQLRTTNFRLAGPGPVNPSRDMSGIAESLNEAVLLALANVDRSERERAIKEAAEAVEPDQLVELIGNDDAVRRNAALEALSKGGRRSVPALV